MKNKSFVLILSALIIIVLVLIVILSSSMLKDCSGNAPSETESQSTSSDDPAESNNPGTTSTQTNDPSFTPEPTPTPTPKPLEGVKIYINAGHQDHGMNDKEPAAPWSAEQKVKCTSGTQGKFTFVEEYKVNLDIALILQRLCEEQGATVIMCRTDNNVTKSNIDRATEANNGNADVALHIHCNGSVDENVKGIEVYTRGNGDNTEEYKVRAAADYSLGTSLLDEVCKTTGANKRNVTKTDAYSTINWAEMPSIIIECGFMSNEEEDNLLVCDEYQEKLAQGMLNWLLINFGER